MFSLIKRYLWQIKYYFYNSLFVKFGQNLATRKVELARSRWEKVKFDFTSTGKDEILIIGNGPSLTAQDLEDLSSLYSIASNKIYLIFDNTYWRPSLVTLCDTLLAYKLRNHTFKELDSIFCAQNVYYLLSSADEKRVPWKNISLDQALETFNDTGKFYPDPVDKGLFEGFSITNQNIQLAMWLGAKKIYVIGVDHFYQEESSENAGSKMVHSGQNHFHPDYRKTGEIVNNAPVKKMDDAYFKMNEIAKAQGVEIINISRKTALTAFKTKATDEAIAEIEIRSKESLND